MAPKSLPERSWGASGAEKKTLRTSKGAQEEFWSDFCKITDPRGIGAALVNVI